MPGERRTDGVHPSVLVVAERARELAASMQPPSPAWSRELAVLSGGDAKLARAAAQLCNEWDLTGDVPSGLAAVVLDDVQLGLTLRDQWEDLR